MVIKSEIETIKMAPFLNLKTIPVNERVGHQINGTKKISTAETRDGEKSRGKFILRWLQ